MHARSFIAIVFLALCAFSAVLASPIPQSARGDFSMISLKLDEVLKKRLISAQANIPTGAGPPPPTDPDPPPPPSRPVKKRQG
ncbi:hypothetical protein BGX26_006607, partial [Mortierella sp. AD094]